MKQKDWKAAQSLESSAAACGPAERRAAPRRPANDPVSLFYRDPTPTVVAATLMDTSEGGFRAEHDRADLSPGQEVRFSWGAQSGTARVVWTRQTDARVESGFLFLSKEGIH